MQLAQPHPHHRRSFWRRHSLGIASAAILTLWIVAYIASDPSTHWGSFFGNAIADWSGVLITVIATKYLFEIGSAESRRPPPEECGPVQLFFHRHSLTVFLLVTGAAWVTAFARMDPNAKWGQVVGNIVSEWTQQFGVILMTKRLVEEHSKESRH